MRKTYGLDAYHRPEYSNKVNLRVFARYEGRGSGKFDPKLLRRAAGIVQQHFYPFMAAPVASHQEVIGEFEDNTSPGVPHKTLAPTKGQLFESVGYGWLEGAYDLYVTQGAPWEGMFLHFLKEEIRKLGKDPHGILASPLDLQYIAMRLFYHQNKQMYDSYLRTWSTIGISRDGLDWHRLWLKLSRFPTGGCSDITEMDASICAEVMDEICRIRQSFVLGPDRDKVRAAIRRLYQTATRTVCLVNNEVFQKETGLPTGFFNTSSDDTLAMAIYLVYAVLTQNPTWGLKEIEEHMAIVLYGDDNDYTHDPDHPELRPEVLFPAMAEAFNLTVKTDGSKPPDKFDFLSAEFLPVACGGQQIMVPLANTKRLAAHVAWGPKNWSTWTEFQRVAAIRQVGIWDPSFCDILEDWLVKHRDEVTPDEFSSLVHSREVLQASYLIPHRQEPVLIPQAKGALNGPAPLIMPKGDYTKHVLEKLQEANNLSEAGANYLKMALDPFPDLEHPIVGLPDGSAGRSCVQQYNQTITIGHPPGLADGATFDVHVAFLNELCDPAWNELNYGQTGFNSYVGCMVQDNQGYYNSTNGEATNQFPWRAPLCVFSVPTGTATFPVTDDSPYNGATCSSDGFDLTDYLGPQSRVIGGGFEVVNTTPELYKGGAVVYYTQPAELAESGSSYVEGGDGTNRPQWGARVLVTRQPPSTVAKAISIPGSVKRAAEEGAYVVIRQQKGQPNPPIEPTRSIRVWMPSSPIGKGVSASVWGFGTACESVTLGSNPAIACFPCSQPIPFDCSGAYFTGLHKSSTLDITLRLFIEVFPNPDGNQALVSLTHPTPPLDDVACELYSKVCAQLPPGVPVSENEDGEWYNKMLEIVADVAPTVGSLLGAVIPGAGLVGSGVGGLATAIDHMTLKKKKKKKKKQPDYVPPPPRPRQPQQQMRASPNQQMGSSASKRKKKALRAARMGSAN